MNFNQFNFKGTFRDYQQNVLDNATEYLENKKIHIVAAPGSGKTILGLELIRRLNSPALILSPNVTIRQQWGERFADGFMDNPESVNDIVSYNLKSPKLLNSVTYQALHAAYNKQISDEEIETDEEQSEKEESEDYAEFDLLNAVKEAGIKTICLDEAHHLKSEWQKALEGFIASLKNDITIISLTATPPYDSSIAEWTKYITLCGDIDAEIFIPQLVKQKTLCPHQDYIYFSYPTKEEAEILTSFRRRAYECVRDIISNGYFKDALYNSKILDNYNNMEERIFENPDEFAAILSLAKEYGAVIPKRLIALVSPKKQLPKFSLETAQKALNFIIQTPLLFGEKASGEIKNAVYKHGFIDNSIVCLTEDKKIKRMLASSMGKLSGINKIVSEESKSLGDNLRMLILTDFIKKDSMQILGSNAPITVMGAVPIFESVRRTAGDSARIALLSGTLVIVPNTVLDDINAIAEEQSINFKSKVITNTNYSELIFGGSNKNKVSVITEAFQSGLINILVGTKSLLGEGWDSPCINSLILASFVGSFMLSNQMRGRAIRTDKNNPDKTSNIWHLVTVEPPFLFAEKFDKVKEQVKAKIAPPDKIISNDYDMLARRFQGFLAPAYSTNIIESGIDRIDIIRPPFNENGFRAINEKTLKLASNRSKMAARWNATLGKFDNPEVSDACEISKSIRPNGFLMLNIAGVLAWISAASTLITAVMRLPLYSSSVAAFIITFLIALISIYFVQKGLRKIIDFISPENTVKTLASCLLKAMKKLDIIKSDTANVVIKTSKSGYSHCLLKNATAHENEVFGTAVFEMMSAIDNPRYVMVKRYKFLSLISYTNSYACPSVLGVKKEYAQALADVIRTKAGNFELIYTRTLEGRNYLYKCKKKSYLNRNEIYTKRNKVVN